MLSTSAFLAVAMQCAATVHPSTSLDVARVESGLNPYAIGIVGQKQGIFPKTKEEALKHIAMLKSQGKRYSLGLMQITSTNFQKYHVSDAQLFDPCTNLSVFEKIMVDCYQRGGNLKSALSCYYSGNFKTGLKKEKIFSDTSYVDRITGGDTKKMSGFIVPGTKELKQRMVSKEQNNRYVVIYPDYIVRGSVSPIAIKGNENE
ncbi:lytic transglycosylase domain-containing protein [Pantoea stewartii]|uniref:lytic transglycosylase domain-containing protein n=1 Tax=Pantoea stewartii TaxID=66269 RepID=UPI0025A2439A|nr:lytic transglycosylase domain-containing protein [Pantoea stewartii]